MNVPEVYNPLIYECAECKQRLRFPDDAIGIGSPPFPSRYSYDTDIYAIIVECPACFTKQWYHGDEGTKRAVEEHLVAGSASRGG